MPKIKIDYDFIEVSDNRYLKLSSRAFVGCPFDEEEFGFISPRAFQVFDSSKNYDGGFFRNAIQEWFPNLEDKVDFLNKFYQCLLVHQLPHKTRKMVLVGESDSGKSSLVNILFGLIPESKVAIVTKESNFGLSMINEGTELLYIDEWCSDMMAADTVKTLLQGGAFPQSVKHQTPRMQSMKAGVFITCNVMPDFGDEQRNVERRLAIYETTQLSNKSVDAPEWMRKNCMSCLAWMVKFLTLHEGLIPSDERFYELPVDVKSSSSQAEDRIPNSELDQIMSCNINDIVVTKSRIIDDTSCELFKKDLWESGMSHIL